MKAQEPQQCFETSLPKLPCNRKTLKSSETMWIIPFKMAEEFRAYEDSIPPTDKDTAYKNLAEKWKSP